MEIVYKSTINSNQVLDRDLQVAILRSRQANSWTKVESDINRKILTCLQRLIWY